MAKLPFSSKVQLFIASLIFKIGCGLGVAYLYDCHYKTGDMLNYQALSMKILPDFFESPGAFLYGPSADLLESFYPGQPRAIFFLKCILISAFITGGNFYLTSLLFSIISFLGSFRLYTAISYYYPKIKDEAIFAFLFLPGYVFWTSGMLKESLANGAICFMVAEILHQKNSDRSKIVSGFLLIISGWLLLELKYYYFGALLPVLTVFYFYKTIIKVPRRNPLRILMLTGLFALGSALAIFFHDHLNPALWPEIISESSLNIYGSSGKPLMFPELAFRIPESIFNAWFSPQIWQVSNLLQLVASTESAILLIIISSSLIFNPNPLKWPLEIWLIIIYSMLLGIFIGLSITNFGSLVRYKTSYYPFLFLACLTGLPGVKSAIKKYICR